MDMIKPRVFFCQEPLHRGRDGHVRPKIDYGPAAKFGEIRFVLKWGDTAIIEPVADVLIWKVREGLTGFLPSDFLVDIGDPTVIKLCGIVASELTDGRFRTLKWDNTLKKYDIVDIDIHCQPPREEESLWAGNSQK